MGRYLKTVAGRAGVAETSGLWKRITALLRRRRFAGIGHLNERMLRDIGLGTTKSSELRQIERLRRP
ncbi:MAG: hypothetical protein E6G89_04285 [Alphaproteobacteria bacterium]|nr:MAG: hypothetical protein E6G87_00385 [Alphaproteobacteria bacterium]TMJ42285.1 MAG: hypothetical protein E6G89_04285 [Alphaproteobacteria bacterium]